MLAAPSAALAVLGAPSAVLARVPLWDQELFQLFARSGRDMGPATPKFVSKPPLFAVLLQVLVLDLLESVFVWRPVLVEDRDLDQLRLHHARPDLRIAADCCRRIDICSATEAFSDRHRRLDSPRHRPQSNTTRLGHR